jgi:hypothetical protein
VLESRTTTYQGKATSTGPFVHQTRTVTRYRNIRGRRNHFGLPLEVRREARTSTAASWQVVEWSERRFNARGQEIELRKHCDSADDAKVYRTSDEFHPITGKAVCSYRYDGERAILKTRTEYFESGPYRFLVRKSCDACGHTAETRTYDLQARGPTLEVQSDGMISESAYDGLDRKIQEFYSGHETTLSRDERAKDSVRYIYIHTTTRDARSSRN